MIQGGYRTKRTWKGRVIIIDLADVKTPLGSGLEVMVMFATTGKEIEAVHPANKEEAVRIYEQMLEKYPEDSRRVTGKRRR